MGYFHSGTIHEVTVFRFAKLKHTSRNTALIEYYRAVPHYDGLPKIIIHRKCNLSECIAVAVYLTVDMIIWSCVSAGTHRDTVPF